MPPATAQMMMAGMNGGPVFPKWSKESKAARVLRQGLQDGEIDPNAPPKAVYESNPLFKQYKLDSFRSAFNKTKTEFGCHIRHGGGGGFTSKLGRASNMEDEEDGFSIPLDFSVLTIFSYDFKDLMMKKMVSWQHGIIMMSSAEGGYLLAILGQDLAVLMSKSGFQSIM